MLVGVANSLVVMKDERHELQEAAVSLIGTALAGVEEVAEKHLAELESRIGSAGERKQTVMRYCSLQSARAPAKNKMWRRRLMLRVIRLQKSSPGTRTHLSWRDPRTRVKQSATSRSYLLSARNTSSMFR